MKVPGMPSVQDAQTIRDKRQEAEMEALKSLAKAEFDPKTMTDKQKEELKIAADGMEAIFAKMMFDEMRKSVKRHESAGPAQDQSRDIFEEMLYDNYAQQLSKTGALGISKMIYNQMTTPVIPASLVAEKYGKL